MNRSGSFVGAINHTSTITAILAIIPFLEPLTEPIVQFGTNYVRTTWF